MPSARAVLVTAAALLLSGCSETPLESLTGCFSMEADGQPVLQVIENDEAFTLTVPKDGDWADAQAMSLGNDELLKTVLGEDSGKAMASLVSANKQIMLIRVDPEQEIAGGKAQSGYLGSFFFGTGQIYRKENCELSS